MIQLANQEAQRFNHEYIGTEHILLGLVKEGSGVAANVLKNLDIDLRMIRLEVEKIVHSGPDMVTTGKLPQTPRAQKVIEYAMEEAKKLSHNYVGTEHLLHGLLREQEGVAAQVIISLGLKLEDVREEVARMLGAPSKAGPAQHATAEHPARRLGRWVRRHELAVVFVGGVLVPFLGAFLTALAKALPDPSFGGLIAGLIYLTLVFASGIRMK